MRRTLLTLELAIEHDVVLARQRARQVAQLLGFDRQDQTRIATAVSEMARNAFRYASGGRVELAVKESPRALYVLITDRGPGIGDLPSVLAGGYRSGTGMGLGIAGARRLMDVFEIESSPERGTRVLLGKHLPASAPAPGLALVTHIGGELARRRPADPLEEIQQQNQELLRTLDELRRERERLAQVNQQLEEAHRGVLALYAELDVRAAHLQQTSELKTKFLSNMTHELRTPLGSITSLTRILLQKLDGDLTPEQEKQVRFIQRSTDGLSELVNDLLDLAKVEAGKIAVRPSEFRVEDLFGTLRGLLRPLLAQTSSVELIFQPPPELPALLTDEAKVSQILRNLVSNALKYTEQGEIRVSVRAAPGDTVVFEVTDTGIGIPEQERDRIFEEWVQVDHPLQQRYRGTGLGLPLSQKLARLLGGRVGVESELGRGSTFHVTLPRRFEGPREGSLEGSGRSPPADPGEVLRIGARRAAASSGAETVAREEVR